MAITSRGTSDARVAAEVARGDARERTTTALKRDAHLEGIATQTSVRARAKEAARVVAAVAGVATKTTNDDAMATTSASIIVTRTPTSARITALTRRRSRLRLLLSKKTSRESMLTCRRPVTRKMRVSNALKAQKI